MISVQIDPQILEIWPTELIVMLSVREPLEPASLLNIGWQNRKERQNRFTSNGDMAITAKRYVACE